VTGPVDHVRHRIDDLLYERPLTPARLVVGVVVLLVAAGLLLLLWWPGGTADPSRLPFVAVSPEPPRTSATARAEVVVHVAGAVARPGLYVRPEGDRVADALDARFGPHVRWGPPGSVASATPPDGQRFRADGTTWVVHLRSGRLLVRRVPEAVGSAPSEPLDGAPRGRQPARVPSAG